MSALHNSLSGAHFATTHWTVVAAAGQGEGTTHQTALADLCRAYWPPLYAYARRMGHSPHDAEDLTQEFFARLLEKQYVADADRAKGRFRSFLLIVFKRFLANEWDKARAQKRGGFARAIPIDSGPLETQCLAEPVDHLAPDKVYDRQWALTLLDRVLHRLRQEQAESGKQTLFDALKERLTGDNTGLSHAEVAGRFGMSEGAVKVAAHRLRERYREMLRQEIAVTVGDASQVEEELRHLFATFAG